MNIFLKYYSSIKDNMYLHKQHKPMEWPNVTLTMQFLCSIMGVYKLQPEKIEAADQYNYR